MAGPDGVREEGETGMGDEGESAVAPFAPGVRLATMLVEIECCLTESEGVQTSAPREVGEVPLNQRLVEVLSRAAREELLYSRKGSRPGRLTRSAWRRQVCHELADLIHFELLSDFDDLSDETVKIQVRRQLVNAVRSVLCIAKKTLKESADIPFFLRHPDLADAENIRSFLEAEEERALDEPQGTRRIDVSQLLRGMVEVGAANPDVHLRHLEILEGHLRDRLEALPVRVEGVEGRMHGVVCALAVEFGEDVSTFTRSDRCPQVFADAWGRVEAHLQVLERRRLACQRMRTPLILRLRGLVVEEKKRMKGGVPKDFGQYCQWQGQALNQLAQILECSADLHVVRDNLIEVLGIGQLASTVMVVGEGDIEQPLQLPQFLVEGGAAVLETAAVQRVVSDISEELRRAMKQPPRQGLTAGPNGRRFRP